MKKRIIFAAAISVLFFSACDFSNIKTPNSISIKTDAALSLDLGSIDYNISSLLNKDEIFSKMEEGLGDGVQVYEYVPSKEDDPDEVLTYMIHYPVASTNLNVGQYLDGLDLDKMLSGDSLGGDGLNFEQKLAVDKISIKNKQTIEVDIASSIEKFSDFKPSASGLDNIVVPETNTYSLSSILMDNDNIKFESIATIVYGTGSAVKLSVVKKDSVPCGENYKLRMRAYICTDSSNATTRTETTISVSEGDAEGYVYVQNGGELLLPLAKDKVIGGELPPKFFLVVDGDVAGDYSTPEDLLTHSHSYEVKVGLSDNLKVEQVNNINSHSWEISPALGKFEIDEIEIPLESAAGFFEKASINEGHISFNTDENPALTGTGMKIDLSISMEGCGFNISESDFIDKTKAPYNSTKFIDEELNLADRTLVMPDNPSDAVIKIKGSVEYDVYQASFDLTHSDNLDIVFNYEAEIESLYDVVINLEKMDGITSEFALPTDAEHGTALPEQLISYVSGISFGQELPSGSGNFYKSDADGNVTSTAAEGFGVICKIKNTLPVEIPVTISSDIFNYNVSDRIISSELEKTYNWIDWPQLDFSLLDNNVPHYIDFGFKFDTKKLTVGTKADPFTLGKEYEISMAMESMKMDWDSITLRSGGLSVPGSQPFEAFNLDSVLSGFDLGETLNNVSLSKLDVFFYLQKPEAEAGSFGSLLDKIGFNGKVYLTYTNEAHPDPADPLESWLLGSKGSSSMIDFKPSITWLENGTKISAGDPFEQNIINPSKYNFKSELAQIINDKPTAFTFNYDLAITSSSGGDLVVYKAMLDGLGEDSNTSIGIDMLAVLPFSLNLKGDITMEFMSMFDPEWNSTNKDKDLLNREDSSAFASYAEYADIIEKFAMYYSVENNVFTDFDLIGSIKDSESNINKELPLISNKNNELQLTGNEISRVMTSYPFHPEIGICLKGGTETEPKLLSIKRSLFAEDNEASLKARVRVLLDLDGTKEVKIPLSLGNIGGESGGASGGSEGGSE